MAAGSKFPLLQLPDKEILLTLRVMDIYQKVSFSLISKRCKQLVQSLQIKAKDISVTIRTSIKLSVSPFGLYGPSLHLYFRDSNEDQRKRLRTPQWVEAFPEGEDSLRLERSDFKYSDWLKHFQDVFHFLSISNIHFLPGSSVYELDDIKEVFRKTDCLNVQNTGCYANNRMVLQKYLPVETLIISPDMFEGSKIPLNILQQNHTVLEIICDDETAEMTLDDLLIMNSRWITIENVRISAQHLNAFIKLWMKGSNPRMEFFRFLCIDGFLYDSAVILKGIKHSEVTIDYGRKMEVYRKDGTCARIGFIGSSIQVLVGFDYKDYDYDDDETDDEEL